MNMARITNLAIIPRSVGKDQVSRLRTAFWLMGGVIALRQAWHYRNTIVNDTISHLDMADAYFRGDWSMAINGCWNPLYAWLLGLAMLVVQPSPYWEYPVVHFLLFLIFLFAFYCFEFFLRELIRFYDSARESNPSAARDSTVPKATWMVLGYSIFLWSSLDLISLVQTNPDMLVTAFVFLASGVLLRIRNGDANWISFLLLGLALGFGYLTKQVMFPLAFVFLAVAMLAVGNLHRAIRHVSIALITFLLISAPLIIALSVAKGRITYGDSGPFAYAVTVNNVAFRHWQGEELGSGIPAHPTRKIFDNPATFEFGSPIGGTYPLWYDITYWYDGVKTRFDIAQQGKAILSNLNLLQELLLGLNGSLIAGLIVMFVASSQGWSIFKHLSEFWFLLLPAVSAVCLYSLVLVEGRYVAPFLPVLLLSTFFGARLREFQRTGKIATAVTVAIALMLMIRFIPGIFSSVADLRNWRNPKSHPYWEVASELRKMGLRAGDKVASVSYANVNNVKWARLARVRIIAEVYHSIYDPEKNDFWKAEPSVQKQVIQAFANLGVRVIVADEEPRGPGTDGWQRIGDTSYFAYFLPT
jgi:hypothetical protein